jgi:hypothetical protein
MKMVVDNPFMTHFPYLSQFACVLTWSTMFVASNLWTKFQDLICFGEFLENVEILFYENCFFYFT